MHGPDDKPKNTNNVKYEETIQLCKETCKTQETKNIETQTHRPIPSPSLPASKPSPAPRTNTISGRLSSRFPSSPNKQDGKGDETKTRSPIHQSKILFAQDIANTILHQYKSNKKHLSYQQTNQPRSTNADEKVIPDQ
jgi:hypothetical protein